MSEKVGPIKITRNGKMMIVDNFNTPKNDSIIHHTVLQLQEQVTTSLSSSDSTVP